jgi:hypothetical protein
MVPRTGFVRIETVHGRTMRTKNVTTLRLTNSITQRIIVVLNYSDTSEINRPE